MFITEAKRVRAIKIHICSWCAEDIPVGEKYLTWNSLDDAWYTNKMHDECLDEAIINSAGFGFEYTPFENERPARGVK